MGWTSEGYINQVPMAALNCARRLCTYIRKGKISIAMMMSPVSPNDNGFVPLTLKGELMDLEFTVDTDHSRKRRRNRTTQSCLNCHTSKRKCDRKRPCQRCIQLGLTGLCVYEIDDPALRDDPSIDENQRLKNRIAELESLVRELRGMSPFFSHSVPRTATLFLANADALPPFLALSCSSLFSTCKPHPRWAESSFRDGDPNEKWHSRATKCAPLQTKRTTSNEDNSLLTGLSPITRNNSASTAGSMSNPSAGPGAPTRNGSMLVAGIKTEDPSNGVGMHGVGGSPQLYRFSPSPQPGQRGAFHPYGQQQQHQIDVRSDGSSGSGGGFDDGERGSNGNRSPYTYGAAAIVAGGANNSGHYSDGGGGGGGGSDDGYHGSPHVYGAGGSNGSNPNGAETGHSTCGCRANPSVHLAYMALASNLQSGLQALRQFHGAAGSHGCPAYRKALELSAVLTDQDSPLVLGGGNPFDGSGPSSDAGDIMTPLSASSAGLSPSALHHPHHLPHHLQQQHAQQQHSPHVQHTTHPHPQQHPHTHQHQQHQQPQHHQHPHSHGQPHPHRQSQAHLVTNGHNNGASHGNGNSVADDEWHHQMAHAAGFSPYFSTPDHHNVYSVGHVMS
ncbi:hypothetical protein D9619_012675 [Psilocybe cf. subviscida]|uniref:Zn(2)-C6 fungal-type domain-containing protein n=1 Tax=Psilocybe cf. subviscida TaxID=2480587 RepID=A0A8H5EZJ7_9AGAR|nr:hypothetical protein D9619_012675 [Psilocybe cf. subviscida]